MKKVLFIAISCAAIICSGCATSKNAAMVKRAQIAVTAPVCKAGQSCDVMWDAAQLWVVHNADYKIQMVTNVLIETYNPGRNSADIAARITKEPIGNDEYKIVASIWCNNLFGCIPNPLDAILDFNNTVNMSYPPKK